ncbi:MAG: ATP-binding protein, partial [Deltaproteobacteria bacterium]
MNDNQAGSELIYRPRWLAPLLAQAISEHPVIILTGARQVGKSTLLQHEKPFSDWLQINLDSLDVLEQAEKDPASLWIGAKEVIIDEVQRVPRLLYEVKQAVDKARHEVRFVLSGSANLLLMRQVSETLAGRAVYFLLTPISLGEVSRKQPPEWFFRVFDGKMPAQKVFGKMASRNVPNLILRGFMPPLLYLKRPEAWVKWWEGYVATYVERDLRQISQIDSLTDFRRVMAILALRSRQVLNQTEVARDSGVSQSTVRRYINLLEVSCLLERLPAFYSSRTKRLIKSPKIF